MEGLSYDGFDFTENGLVVTNLNHMILPDRENQIEKIAGRPGGELVQSELGVKPIPIEGWFTGDTIIEAQQMYDTLAEMINRQQRPLIVPHAGSFRRFIATPQNAVIQEPDGLNRIIFSFEFVVPSASSSDTETSELVNETVTTASATIPLEVEGSIPARPLITLTFDTVTGGTDKTVTIRNARDFIGLSITRTFTAGDEITIDSSNYQIYINDVLTEPDGRFPQWQPGTGSLFYSDTFTTRSVDIVATYTPNYL